MAGDISCDNCGGDDFYNEAGYYYCRECQTQSQQIQEHAFEENVTATPTQIKTKKIRKKVQEQSENQLTSWECYNYILLGLVNELIELGAGVELKNTVQVLWYKYLRALQVVGDDPNAPPKLPAVNCKVDAEILFGRKKQKRRRSRSHSPSSASEISSSEPSLRRKEAAKRKRALTQAQYEDFISTQQSETTSLHNQSLVSLRTPSEASTKDVGKYLTFTTGARKALLKTMKKGHFQKHRKDTGNTMRCHPNTHRRVSQAYTRGSEVMTRSKLFALVYLGLLVNKDKVQLGDLLRFKREGHLSYNEYNHFFPEELANMRLNVSSYAAQKSLLSHFYLRENAAKLAVKLHVTKYVPVQNLLELCERYVKELNLPGEIFQFARTLISRDVPDCRFTRKSKIVPNYEARAMSYVIFVLKLLFGLDDATEFHFSNLAEKINSKAEHFKLKRKMFNFVSWIKFLQYRKLILTEEHFPTNHLFEAGGNPILYANFLKEHKSKFEDPLEENIESEVLKIVLRRLTNQQNDLPLYLTFPCSMTPFHDYLRVVLDSMTVEEKQYMEEILRVDHVNTSLDFLMDPYSFLDRCCEDVEVVHSGANDNLEFIELANLSVRRDLQARRRESLVLVDISRRKLQENEEPNGDDERKRSPRTKLNDFSTYNSKHFRKYVKKQRRRLGKPDGEEVLYDKHYHPEERFWLCSRDVSKCKKEDFDGFLGNFPYSFQLLLGECARVVEQSSKDLFEEYNLTEIYLCYKVFNPSFKNDKGEVIFDKELKRLLRQAVRFW